MSKRTTSKRALAEINAVFRAVQLSTPDPSLSSWTEAIVNPAVPAQNPPVTYQTILTNGTGGVVGPHAKLERCIS